MNAQKIIKDEPTRLSRLSEREESLYEEESKRASPITRPEATTPAPTLTSSAKLQRTSAKTESTSDGVVSPSSPTELSTEASETMEVGDVQSEVNPDEDAIELPGQTDASTATQFVSEDQRRGQSGDSDDSGDTSEDDEYDTDLDVSEEMWHPVIKHDVLGHDDYIAECNRLGVIPASYFLRHVQDQTFVMRHHGLGPLGAKAIAKPLEINTTIEKLDLEGNSIESAGAKFIGRMLRENIFITELVLSENNLQASGCRDLCNALTENTNIVSLDLSGNGLTDQDGEMFYKLLEANVTLRRLYLRHNGFEQHAAEWIRDVMSCNVTLRVLDLSWNHIRGRGALHIAQGVRENDGLVELDLQWNGFGVDGACAMGHALAHNDCLEELDLSHNRIAETDAVTADGNRIADGATALAKALVVNTKLQAFKLAMNPINEAGCLTFLRALERNEDSKLHYLNLWGSFVCNKFEESHQNLMAERQREIKIIHSGTKGQRSDFGQLDLEKMYLRDPMTKLRRYADEAGLRLIDLFKQFDKDKSWTVDREEFVMGIKFANIPLSEAEIDKLINSLDQDGDGEIDYRELQDGDHENRQEKIKVRAWKKENQTEGDPDLD